MIKSPRQPLHCLNGGEEHLFCSLSFASNEAETISFVLMNAVVADLSSCQTLEAAYRASVFPKQNNLSDKIYSMVWFGLSFLQHQ